MSVTYKKPLKTIQVKAHGIDEKIEVADTTTETPASNAFSAFERGHKMVLDTQDGKVYVPYHSVEAVYVTQTASDDITRPDPYCKDGDGTNTEPEPTPEPTPEP